MKLLHDVVGNQAALPLEKAAVIHADDGRAVSYDQLARHAGAVSRRLLGLGLEPGRRVAVLAQKSPEVIAAFLAASEAGIVYAPLDIAAPPAYWASILRSFAITDVLTDNPGLAQELPGVRLIEIGPAAGDEGTGLAGPRGTGDRSADDDAYILTTSGSTGHPKGVVLSHANAFAFSNWAADAVGLQADDKVLSIAPFHFDLSIFDIYATLSRRASVVLAPRTATLFPGQLLSTIEDHAISVLYTVPSILQTLLDAGGFENDACKSLKTIMYAGEPFPKLALSRLMRALPHVTFHNFFGPTETNVSIAYRFTKPLLPDDEVPIGRPASDARITLRCEDGTECPTGEIGEVIVDGPTVMKGYLTADGFKPAARPLATGDFARLGPDGNYYFCGRRDQQVKLRGVRIELEAIASALMQSAEVNEAAALIINADLVGFVATAGEIDPEQLRDRCRRCLPAGAVPARIVAVARLPRLSNGKLNIVLLRSIAEATIRRASDAATTGQTGHVGSDSAVGAAQAGQAKQ